MITFHKNQDIFTTNCDFIVNTVNCVGVMGKGLALQFKQRYPVMFNDYRTRCYAGMVKPGVPYIYNNIVNFPTKDHWRNPSKLEWVISGLKWIKQHSDIIKSIAIPPVGCGLGGLDYNVVERIIVEMFIDTNIDVHFYTI